MRNRLTVDDLQKPLTFDSISPVWAVRLEQQQQPIPLSFKWLRWCLEMISFSKCVVGEAHGFSSSYTSNCQECWYQAWFQYHDEYPSRLLLFVSFITVSNLRL